MGLSGLPAVGFIFALIFAALIILQKLFSRKSTFEELKEVSTGTTDAVHKKDDDANQPQEEAEDIDDNEDDSGDEDEEEEEENRSQVLAEDVAVLIRVQS